MPDGLFDAVLARGGAAEAVTDAAWLAAMLDAEAALARASASAGVISREAAEAVVAACSAGGFDVAALGREAASSGNPVVPLVLALRERAGAEAHRGATSQDILDTAAMLVARGALAAIGEDLAGAAAAAAGLARTHRSLPMVGRTLLQHAVPVTFGLVAAGWLEALDGAGARLQAARGELAVQLGGASGTLAVFGDAGPAVLAAFARELELAEPALPWHTDRGRIAALAGALGGVSGAVAKVAGDIVLLAQTDVGEVREEAGDRGESSAMPHKRNPVAAISARACAHQAPGLVATLLAAGEHELQRAAGAWHAEWRPWSELLRSTGSAAAWLRDALEHLVVDADAMRANLDRSGGLVLAERVATETGERDVVRAAALEAARGEWSFSEALEARGIRAELDPAGSLGSAEALVDRALAAHDARGGGGTAAAPHRGGGPS